MGAPWGMGRAAPEVRKATQIPVLWPMRGPHEPPCPPGHSGYLQAASPPPRSPLTPPASGQPTAPLPTWVGEVAFLVHCPFPHNKTELTSITPHLVIESVHFHQTQCLKDRDRVFFIPKADATQSLIEETPCVNCMTGFLLIVPSLPREDVFLPTWGSTPVSFQITLSTPTKKYHQNNTLKTDVPIISPPDKKINKHVFST